MAGEGFIAHMIASMKINKRSRVSTYDKIKNFKKGNNIQVHFKNKATESQLTRIREKIKEENKKSVAKK